MRWLHFFRLRTLDYHNIYTQVYLNVQPTTSMMLRSVPPVQSFEGKKPWSSYSPWCSSHRHSFPSTQKVSQENKIITLDFHIIHPHHKKVMVVLPPSIVISDYYGDLGTRNVRNFCNVITPEGTTLKGNVKVFAKQKNCPKCGHEKTFKFQGSDFSRIWRSENQTHYDDFHSSLWCVIKKCTVSLSLKKTVPIKLKKM